MVAPKFRGKMRYPGGKSFIANKILTYFNKFINTNTQFVDVFAGGLTMTIKFAKHFQQVNKYWINDKDPGMASIWSSYISCPDNLITQINLIKPEVQTFFKFQKELSSLKEMPTNTNELLEIAAKKIMIHQCSYSGLGLKGGVQGGHEQNKKDKITTNWNPKYQAKKINEFQTLFAGKSFFENKCTCLDFESVIEYDAPDDLLYLDPPYFEKGKKLYFYYFDESAHIRLANALKNTSKNWILSYDDCEFIKNLYSWAKIDYIQNDNRLQMIEDKNGKRKANTKFELVIQKPV
jgi:DNA adenine methylase